MVVPRANAAFSDPRPRGVAAFVGAGVALTLTVVAAREVTFPERPTFIASATQLVTQPAASVEETKIWTMVTNASPLFVLEPAPAALTQTETRHFGNTDARSDTFVVGDPAKGTPFARLMVDRVVAASPDAGSFYLTVAREAAASGLGVVRLVMPGTASTRFGIMETADLTLATPLGPVACTAFRGTADNGPLRYAGWSCGADAAGTRRAARCLVDSLAFVKGVQDPALASTFRNAEGNRDASCGPARIEPDQEIEPPVVRLDKKKPKRN